MDLSGRVAALGRIGPASTPVVTVYLGTRWADEHQRARVRIFLKNELAQARRASHPRAAPADLDWIEAQGEALVDQATMPDAGGVALFACEALGLREMLPSRIPFENVFAVGETPLLRPLMELDASAPTTLVVFIDTASARLVTLTAAGPGEEVALRSDVPGHHSRGGWAQLAQSRYRRHIQDHRARHFDAVVEALTALVDGHGVRRIVLAGEPRNVAVFRQELPPRLAAFIVGIVAGAQHEAMGRIVARAAEYLPHVEGQREAEGVDGVLTAAAKHGKAAAGLDATLEAVNRGAVHRLYLLKGWSAPGRRCDGCGTLQRSFAWACPACGGEAETLELGEAMADRVVAAGGSVETIEVHQPLAAAGGVAAELRYPL
ncbi:MAG TPA: Vms1/Ankzf1 family peptidyl-tRNA hydrolase [Verrucomicrobiae bacterium]|jgi:peptide subunit release factor 1 (eRF1)|nr:Vms1/Ankzf1 family peptidyl-tRNA hydrolase [Verrucomicrobiae bacterium]